MITQMYNETSISRFFGLSTDTKPTDCPNGSKFYEINTGKQYLFDKENVFWREFSSGSGGGGGGGTTDYTALTNKPSINNVTLVGNKTLSDLGLNIVIDTELSLSSDNPVQNKVVTGAINDIGDILTPISELASLVPTKQDALSESQMAAVNSGINSEKVAEISSNTAAIAQKVDKVAGKGLSTEDYTTAEKTQLAANTTAIAGKQDALSSAQLAAVNSGINSEKVATIVATSVALDDKVDKVQGKGLSTNDYTDADKTQLALNALRANTSKILTDISISGQVFVSNDGWQNGNPSAQIAYRNYLSFTEVQNRIASPRVSTDGAAFIVVNVEDGYRVRVLFWQSTGAFVNQVYYAYVESYDTDRTEWHTDERIVKIPECAKAVSVSISKTDSGSIETSDYNKASVRFVKKNTPLSAIKSGVFLGDSISFGFYSYWSGENRKNADDVTDQIEYTKTSRRISDWFGHLCGAKIDNLALRGTGYVADPRNIGNALAVATNTDFSNYDFVALCFGVNDYIRNVSLGVDASSAEGTVAGNLSRVLRKIYNDNPFAKVVVFTPYNTWGQYRDSSSSSKTLYGDETSNYALGFEIGGKTLQAVIDVIHTVCDYYGVEIVDLSKGNVINRINIKDVLVDGLHPCEEVMGQLAAEMYGNMTFK